MSALARLVAGDAAVEVVPGIGGGIASFSAWGVDVLAPASRDALAAGNVRGLASYPLVPCSNRIAFARLRVGETTHTLARNFGDHPHAIHGIGWQRAWRVAAGDDRRLTLELRHDARDAHAWPFAFRARQAFALEAAGDAVALSTTLAIESEDARPFPFGLGFHPFFARRPGTLLEFRAMGMWQADSTRIPTVRTAIPDALRFDRPREVDSMTLDDVFDGWDGRARIAWPREGIAATIDADRALSHLVVYVPADGHRFAVEPVSHATDAFNSAAAGAREAGTRTLRPGGTFSCTMRVTVSRAG
jgi:aldose 1-epimerase